VTTGVANVGGLATRPTTADKRRFWRREGGNLCGGNKFMPLLSKVCRRMEGGHAACPYEGKAQPTRCWGSREDGHVLWGCSNRAAWPRRAEAQHVRKVRKRKCGECGGVRFPRVGRYKAVALCHKKVTTE